MAGRGGWRGWAIGVVVAAAAVAGVIAWGVAHRKPMPADVWLSPMTTARVQGTWIITGWPRGAVTAGGTPIEFEMRYSGSAFSETGEIGWVDLGRATGALDVLASLCGTARDDGPVLGEYERTDDTQTVAGIEWRRFHLAGGDAR